MNKRKLIYLLIGVIFVGLMILGVILKNQPKKEANPSPTPIPSIAPQGNLNTMNDPNRLQFVSSVPEQSAPQVATTLGNITLTFNKAISLKDISIKLIPTVSFVPESNGNDITLVLKQPLRASTLYTVDIDFTDPKLFPRTLSFTTVGPTPTIAPDTSSLEVVKQRNQSELKKHPDVFLSNNTPHDEGDFSITSDFTAKPEGHFVFTVTLKNADKQKAKDSLVAWLKSLGLTKVDLISLDIIYK
ncbi:Ig-like domain-containing protein [Candidatus Roizmanbacteria bacterium]|nr:Ig-like domain-containing protein [Candidatus Roizmanbacteria bacterium]